MPAGKVCNLAGAVSRRQERVDGRSLVARPVVFDTVVKGGHEVAASEVLVL